MEKIEREALDFMNVESFSQLPFIPPKEKPIRLFGKEFGGGGGGGGGSNSTMTTTNMSESIDSNFFHDEPETNMVNHKNCTPKENHIGKNDEIRKKYECHYCFRNFPTSQALGGHQNAHKKERQNAKRAHLQPPTVHDTSVYGRMDRYRLGEASTTKTHHHSTWTNINNTTTTRFYGNGHHVISPNYSQAVWRIPPAVHQNNSPSTSSILVFSNDDLRTTSPVVKISSNCERNFGYEPKGEVQDHVSLDLHL